MCDRKWLAFLAVAGLYQNEDKALMPVLQWDALDYVDLILDSKGIVYRCSNVEVTCLCCHW